MLPTESKGWGNSDNKKKIIKSLRKLKVFQPAQKCLRAKLTLRAKVSS